MLLEARSSADVVRRQLRCAHDDHAATAGHLRAQPPSHVHTLARGSSGCAAAFLSYLLAARHGVPAGALQLSALTLHDAPLQVRGSLAVAISQSGQSPDLVTSMQRLSARGASTLALVNQMESPLAQACLWRADLRAGPELSVAATKSFVASLVASALLVSHWRMDAAMLKALDALPHQLDTTVADHEIDATVRALAPVEHLLVIGRGFGLPLAQEAALKLKEACGMHAQALSGAEAMHGPVSLAGRGRTALVFATGGPELPGLIAFADHLRRLGTNVVLAAPPQIRERTMTLTPADMPELDAVPAIRSFYEVVAALATARGFDADQPPHLRKVTLTL
ncbi:SIS domain-containing protein [Albitalea terrae]|uniref:SIS domain-containing protein n=1 Tax=Piscinibacter terrae TaxID=2496871 RepID=A0A3N7HMJ8_9BURK|nr:SIS domain-containing protein [Albitalea terrae]